MAKSLRKVLIVDDIEMNRLVLRRILERLGYTCVECRTGIEALQAFIRHQNSIACVLMDINMPEMDGLEAAFRIRQLEARTACKRRLLSPSIPQTSHERLSDSQAGCHRAHQARNVPIWAVSACTNDEQLYSPVRLHIPSDRLTGPLWQIVGMDAFLSKPVRVSELLCKLNELEEGASNSTQHLPQNLQSHRTEGWDDAGLQRRCSFSEQASTFSKNMKEPNLQHRAFLVSSEAD